MDIILDKNDIERIKTSLIINLEMMKEHIDNEFDTLEGTEENAKIVKEHIEDYKKYKQTLYTILAIIETKESNIKCYF